MTYLERLWALKRRVAAGKYPVTGICSAAYLTCAETRMMRRWPEYSGLSDYPVPGVGGSCAGAAYSETSCLWVGAYGGARMRLLNWLIRQEEAKHA